MSPDLFFWVLSRVTGLASFASLAIAIVTGVALRTALFDWLSSNRAIRGTHEFTTILWIPLGLLHVATIVLDQTPEHTASTRTGAHGPSGGSSAAAGPAARREASGGRPTP